MKKARQEFHQRRAKFDTPHLVSTLWPPYLIPSAVSIWRRIVGSPVTTYVTTLAYTSNNNILTQLTHALNWFHYKCHEVSYTIHNNTSTKLSVLKRQYSVQSVSLEQLIMFNYAHIIWLPFCSDYHWVRYLKWGLAESWNSMVEVDGLIQMNCNLLLCHKLKKCQLHIKVCIHENDRP